MKKKQAPKMRTKEELLASLKGNAVFKEKMAFTREKFYPALIEATTSIDDAQQNLYTINTVIMEKFLGLMKEKTMKDIKLVDNLSKDDPKYEQMVELVSLFDNFSVFDAKDLLEGMRNEISLFLTNENKSRSLADLKVVWIDQM